MQHRNSLHERYFYKSQFCRFKITAWVFRKIEHKILFIEQICLTSIHRSFYYTFILIDKTGHVDKNDGTSKIMCYLFSILFCIQFFVVIRCTFIPGRRTLSKGFSSFIIWGSENLDWENLNAGKMIENAWTSFTTQFLQ